LTIGTAISWIPIIEYLGIFINFIGLIYLFIGRKNCLPSHETYLILSILLLILGEIIGIFVANSFFSQNYSSFSSIQSLKATITSDFTSSIYSAFAGELIIAIAFVLITFALQDRNGRFILLIGFLTNIIVNVIIADLFVSTMSQAISQAFSGNTFNDAPLKNTQGILTAYTLLEAIPLIIYAIAYYRLYKMLDDLPV
ncbi:MAG: hypothetical protein ACYDDC_01565, partial [Thermoplasmataceae archaeon]